MRLPSWLRLDVPPVRGGNRALLRRLAREATERWVVANAKTVDARRAKAARFEANVHRALQRRFWGQIASILKVLRG